MRSTVTTRHTWPNLNTRIRMLHLRAHREMQRQMQEEFQRQLAAAQAAPQHITPMNKPS